MTDIAPPTIRAIKGFSSGMKCRDMQFEFGQTYTAAGPIKACKNGFHAVPVDHHPLSVFEYYPPAGSIFCYVEISGRTDTDGNKIAGEILKVGDAIPDLAAEAVKWVMARSKPEGAASATGTQGAASATGTRGAASATGYHGAASATGYHGAASATGDHGAASATGTRGAASATGDQGAASATGDHGAASATGYQGAASATGYQGAASATGDQGAASATGDQGAASATGDQGAASATGTQGAASATGTRGAASATGYHGAASATGYAGCVMGAPGCALYAIERATDYSIISNACGIVGRDGIEPNVWYRCKAGKLVRE